MYARERAEVSARQRNRIPAGVGERNAVRKNSGDRSAHLYSQTETRGSFADRRRSSATVAAMRHAEKASAIVDCVAVDDDRRHPVGFDMGTRSGECEFFGARYDDAYVRARIELAHRE